VLATRLFGCKVSPIHCTNDDAPRLRFSATLGEETEVEVRLM
jgi:hypothetical protein